MVDPFGALHEDPGADRLGRGAADVGRLRAGARDFDKFEFPVLVLLCTLGMMLMISANEHDRALSRARAAVAGDLRARRDQPRQSALDRSRPEVFRARRAVVGHAALRHQPGLRLHRQCRLRADRRGAHAAATASSAWSSAWSSCSPALPSRSRPCRSTCGRPTSTKARRRRSPRSSPPPPRWRRWR